MHIKSTACSLYQLLSDAYSESSETDFETFLNEKSSVPQFRFWLTTLELELLLLTFVRSLREGNFHLYIEAPHKMAPWFFFRQSELFMMAASAY